MARVLYCLDDEIYKNEQQIQL